MKTWIRIAFVTAIGVGGCSSSAPPPGAVGPTPEPTPGDWYGDVASKVITLDQGWTPAQSEWFYFTPQGSELMPYAMFIALEQADGEGLVRDPHNMRRLRYVTGIESASNPDDLPIGFVRDGDALGLTCAACHTTQINYKGTGIRIDGGPAMADFAGFLDALVAAIDATLRDGDKFDRFAARMRGGAGGDGAALRSELTAVRDALSAEIQLNRSDTRYGFARLDAFGRIFNRALTLVDPNNRTPANAPVSYPFLWDTPQHDYVQWNGFASNFDGGLQRNVGQLVGVFAAIDIGSDVARGYTSSIRPENLVALEKQIAQLRSPQWPSEVLPALKPELVATGRGLYDKHCASCHQPIDRADPKREVRAQMYALEVVGTDPLSAMNIVRSRGKTGIIAGRKLQLLAGAELGAEATTIDIVTHIIAGLLAGGLEGELAAAFQASLAGEGAQLPPRQGKLSDQPGGALLAYKARPLNGIWATAPYLHNGSVPTLYDLLLPAGERPASFWVGRLEFDPVKVGFVIDRFDGGFEFDTSLPGNASAGHNYATTLSDAERWALVEYLKSL